MTVTAQTPYNVSTANGVATTFAYSFLILDEDDLVVEVDGVVKTITTHYTVTGVGSGSGGNVVFVTAPANGAEVVRRRATSLTRSTDYQTSGDFLADTVDDDFDRLWLAMQDQDSGIGLSLHFPVTVSGVSTELPEPTATYVLRVNAAGTGFEFVDSGDVVLAIPADQSVPVAKMSASAADVLFGRSSPGAGAGQEIACTAAGRALLDDASASAQRTTLGLGTAAVESAARLTFTGMIAEHFGTTAPTGWVARDGTTVGSATSGATGRANADTADLFSLLWGATSNTDYPIQDSAGTPTTRGASAAADFSANKRFPLPDDRGVFVRGLNTSGSGYDASRTLGTLQSQAGGLETVKTYATDSGGPNQTITVPQDGTESAKVVTGDAASASDQDITFANAADLRPVNRAYLPIIKL